jgi:hypothetical protein
VSVEGGSLECLWLPAAAVRPKILDSFLPSTDEVSTRSLPGTVIINRGGRSGDMLAGQRAVVNRVRIEENPAD